MTDTLRQFANEQPKLAELRRKLHSIPETAFEEVATSALILSKLTSPNFSLRTGLAKTGIVASLRCGSSSKSIGLRADMDGLDIHEANEFDHRSTHSGKMHACGHDGHTAMLLAAALHLEQNSGFDGVVHFIFQPAEENEGGGRRMIEEGLFEEFQMDAVFSMHNIPAIPLGQFAVKPGPIMAGFDVFDIIVEGRGAHAAMPHQGQDPISSTAALIQALNTIVSRNIDPIDTAVLSITKVQAGSTYNVIPDTATISGTVRYFSEVVRDTIEQRIHAIAAGVGAAHSVSIDVQYDKRYPPTINSPAETEQCAALLEHLFGSPAVSRNPRSLMASEDFAYMLQKKPGCYVLAGSGSPGAAPLHNPHYEFNDALLPFGAAYWVELVRTLLPQRSA